MEQTLVNEYIALDREMKKMDARKKQIAEIIKADMIASGMDRVDGEEGYIKLVNNPETIVPAQEAKIKRAYSYIRPYRF